MSNVKDLNNDELRNVNGGETNSHHDKFQAGDWFKGDIARTDEVVYYVKEVLNGQYYLIKYCKYPPDQKKLDPNYKIIDIGYQPTEFYNSILYFKIDKPEWI